MTIREDYHRGAEQLLNFLAAEYDDNGVSRSAPDNIQFYYKLPAVFSYGDRRAFALQTLRRFEEKFFVDGHLKLDPFAASWEAYIAGWVAWGAGALGRFDVAKDIIGSVLPAQNTRYGGFVSEYGNTPIMDTERSGGAAMGCVWGTQPATAVRVAGFLEYALEHQPGPAVFYTYFDTQGTVVPVNTDRMAYFSLDDPHAFPAMFGTTVSSLVWLGRLTGDRHHFDTAHRYMKLVLANHHDPAGMPLATKLAWSGLMLSRHVNDQALVDFAHRTGDAILSRQQSDGSLDFDAVPDVTKPIDKVWHIGWGCDAVLTLIALGNGGD